MYLSCFVDCVTGTELCLCFTSQIGAGPVGEIAAETALVEEPSRLLEDEFGVGLGELGGGGGRVVPGPFRTPARDVVQVLHDPVGGHDVGTGRHQGLISLELGSHMPLAVIGVEDDQHGLAGLQLGTHLLQRAGRGGAPLDEGDEAPEFVGLDAFAVVRPDLDIDADDPSLAHRLKQ